VAVDEVERVRGALQAGHFRAAYLADRLAPYNALIGAALDDLSAWVGPVVFDETMPYGGAVAAAFGGLVVVGASTQNGWIQSYYADGLGFPSATWVPAPVMAQYPAFDPDEPFIDYPTRMNPFGLGYNDQPIFPYVLRGLGSYGVAAVGLSDGPNPITGFFLNASAAMPAEDWAYYDAGVVINDITVSGGFFVLAGGFDQAVILRSTSPSAGVWTEIANPLSAGSPIWAIAPFPVYVSM
ncbi:hypothetical protein, partial [Methylomagnum sp.]